MTNLTFLATQIHETACEKGFYEHADENPSIDAEKIALIHSEASEMLEALRKAGPEELEEETADLIIRALDYAAFRGMDIERAVKVKMAKNRERPHKHGNKF